MENRLKTISRNDLDRIHGATVKVLTETGIAFRSAEARDIFKKHGAKVDHEIVFISRKMLADALDTVPDTFEWHARKPSNSVIMGNGQVRTNVALNGGPIYIQDLDGGRRLGKMEDLINCYKLGQTSQTYNIAGQVPVVPSDIDEEGRHLQIFYQLLKHTDKPLMGIEGTQTQIRETFDMLEIALGQKDVLIDRPSIGVSICPLSPLSYGSVTCESILAYAKQRQPVVACTCAMSGLTAPISLMGTTVMMNAELLAGLVLTQLVNPGTPYVYSPGSAVPNLKTAGYITGSPESNLINMAGIQLTKELYNLPCRCMAGLTDAKIVDCQAGYETMQNFLLLMLAGANLINECFGVLDSIMTTCYEKIIIDAEMIDRVLRMMQGMDTSDEAMAIDIIQEVAQAATYIMHPSTNEHCRELWSPVVSHWDSYEEWQGQGSEDVVVRANRKYKEILQSCPESLIDPEIENDLQLYLSKKKSSRKSDYGK
jgi:trimethylamine--corrinoid protein Co-methyltransferase